MKSPMNIRILLLLPLIFLSACASRPGNETAPLRGTIRAIGNTTRAAIRDGKEILTNLQGAERDAKEIRRILFPSPRP